MTSDPHTLDEYAETLRELETDGRAVAVHVLACKLHGVPAATKMRQATTLALDELVAQGRAEQSYPGRYRATRREEIKARLPVPSEGLVAAVQRVAEMIDPPSRPGAPKLPVYVNGVELTERAVTVAVPEVDAPKLNEPGFVARVNRAAGAVVDAMFGVSEYPDAIIAEAEVFAKRAAKALEMARAELERAEAAEKSAAEAHCAAAGATLAAAQRVKRLERIAGSTE